MALAKVARRESKYYSQSTAWTEQDLFFGILIHISYAIPVGTRVHSTTNSSIVTDPKTWIKSLVPVPRTYRRNAKHQSVQFNKWKSIRTKSKTSRTNLNSRHAKQSCSVVPSICQPTSACLIGMRKTKSRASPLVWKKSSRLWPQQDLPWFGELDYLGEWKLCRCVIMEHRI